MAGSNAPAGKSGNLLGLKIGLAVILYVALEMCYRGVMELIPVARRLAEMI